MHESHIRDAVVFLVLRVLFHVLSVAEASGHEGKVYGVGDGYTGAYT